MSVSSNFPVTARGIPRGGELLTSLHIVGITEGRSLLGYEQFCAGTCFILALGSPWVAGRPNFNHGRFYTTPASEGKSMPFIGISKPVQEI